MSDKNLEKKYDPKLFEERLYRQWEKDGNFGAEPNPDKEPFTIVLPPPNITGQLHMGHALDQTIQDILIRFKRMQGFEALWLPGTDHASIATEVKVVEKIMKEEGKSKDEIGRDEFLERAWEWKAEYGDRIVDQMKKLGSSCDWTRERFTMDEGCNKAVTEVFVKLYEEGHIYRGNRLINWCPDCKTSLSDAEVEHEEHKGNFWHVRYPIKDGTGFIEIATTRPETILGDTAIAVNPKDEKYSELVGKTVIVPLIDREIPVIADSYVDMDFGTGAVKITPAHDPNDFEVGQRHDLEQINVMNEDATMNENAGKYEGMDRYECRKALVGDLDEGGFLVKTVEHQHNVGTCYRCHTVVEPLVSEQWFVKMDELVKPVIKSADEKDIEIVPEKFKKVYMHWLENIRDWCISRQLWWGHRIPAYYCHDCGETIVASSAPDKCTKCGSANLVQDEDVLDTWFSSALWPFSTLGWPDKTADLEYFYPTDVLVTGYDIIFFWVIRMAFSGYEQMNERPFKYVLVHGLVRDDQGRKMSKSLGNGIDPLEVIDLYGADALRFMLASGNSPGNDLRFYMERVEASRNFANKLWNASRFVLMNLEDEFEIDRSSLSMPDAWILSRTEKVGKEITSNLEQFELGLAAQKLYDFIWNEFCDWYIELAKSRFYGDDEKAKKQAQAVILKVLKDLLKLLHPFMPFITEEIWQHLPGIEGSIMLQDWPGKEEGFSDESAEKGMSLVMGVIKSVRNIRAEMNVAPSKKVRIVLIAGDYEKATVNENMETVLSLANVTGVEFKESKDEIESDTATSIFEGVEIFIPMDDLVDYEKEMERLSKEKAKVEKELERVSQKLVNEGFLKKAPEALVEQEKEKKKKFKDMYDKIIERIDMVNRKL